MHVFADNALQHMKPSNNYLLAFVYIVICINKTLLDDARNISISFLACNAKNSKIWYSWQKKVIKIQFLIYESQKNQDKSNMKNSKFQKEYHVASAK